MVVGVNIWIGGDVWMWVIGGICSSVLWEEVCYMRLVEIGWGSVFLYDWWVGEER